MAVNHYRPWQLSTVGAAQTVMAVILLCVLSPLPLSSAQQSTLGGTGAGACVQVDLDTNERAVCNPCPESKWFDLIMNQRAETDHETSCFNSFPLGTHLAYVCPVAITKGHDHPKLDFSSNPKGFIMTKSPFFRFNKPLEKTSNPSCPGTWTAVIQQQDKLDIGLVEPYYQENQDPTIPPKKSPPELAYDVDVQVLEWPGRTSEKQKEFLNEKLLKECADGEYKSHKPALCSLPEWKNAGGKPQPNFRMLKFKRESSKLLHYPCNKEEGTSITALGLMAVYNWPESDDDPHSKVFFSYGNTSIFKTYGHPLYVSELILNQMSKSKGVVCRKRDEEPANCDFTGPSAQSTECEERMKHFLSRGDIELDNNVCNHQDCFTKDNGGTGANVNCLKSMTGDLVTVLDFTFVEGRLLLGMRCGILIISDFLKRQLNIRPATLLTSAGKHKNTFSAVTKIASSFCCKPTGCRRTLIAAYSSHLRREVDDPKEIYVSFDLGETFQAKLVAEHFSALNLIWGMYKLYGDWLLYYQLLENPDPEDLKTEGGEELHPGYVDLRSVPDWDSLTLDMKEKRFLYGETTSETHIRDFEVKKRAMKRFIRLRSEGALRRFIRYEAQGRIIELDLAPKWLQQEIDHVRKEAEIPWLAGRWTDANCDSIPECRNSFVNDPAVAYFLKQAEVIIKTPKRHAETSFCDQIMSIAVLEEEDSLYVLCQVGFGDVSDTKKGCSSRQDDNINCTYPVNPTPGKPSKTFAYNSCVNPIKYYAIYSFAIKEKLPIVTIEERRSERLFTCKPITVNLDWNGCKKLQVQPELVRVPKSVTLLVKNCQEVLYYSPNGGRTIFHTQFYANESEFAYTSQVSPPCLQSTPCDYKSGNTHQRQMMYRIKTLNVPPLIAISPTNNVVFMTAKGTYAYGLLGVNKEFRMIVGDIFNTTGGNILTEIRSNNFVFPCFTESGVPFFGVALKFVYSHNKILSCSMLSERHGMRLVRMDFILYKDLSYYYEENDDLDAEARNSRLGIGYCNTYAFSVKPHELVLDVDESGIIEVTSFDPHPNVHLGLVSSEEKSILVDVSFVDRERKEKEHLAHDWDIHVTAIRNYKPRITALVDSFFGAENNNMFGYYTEIGMANDVEFRCLVQPAATVSAHIECREERLVIHEDEHRPQCTRGTFSKAAFEYRLRKGQFDPNLAGYWMTLDEDEGKELIKVDRETGDLVITYDYLRFGCPLEPYKDEIFIPDLRIATAETGYNSSLGQLYNGSFLLIELFGAKGFLFEQTYQDYGCTHVPLNITNATLEWVHRHRLFRIASERQTTILDDSEIDAVKTYEEFDAMEFGDKLFHPKAADHPINIVNRVTYRDCKQWRSFLLETENASFPNLDTLSPEEKEAHLQQPLQILQRGGENVVSWSKRSQEVYIFIAIALDPTESLCEYYTIFGVHLPEVAEIDAIITMLVFLCFTVLWFLLFVCGFVYRKSRIRKMCIQLERKHRLEEAAWKIVYQYEKLLQENENRKFEDEFREFGESAESSQMEQGRNIRLAQENENQEDLQ